MKSSEADFAILRLADDFHITERLELLTKHLPSDGFVISVKPQSKP
jgi:hypothetical protein